MQGQNCDCNVITNVRHIFPTQFEKKQPISRPVDAKYCMPARLLIRCLSICDGPEGVPDDEHPVLWQWQLEVVLQLPPVEGQALACWASETVLADRKPSRQAQSYRLSVVSKRPQQTELLVEASA